MDGIDDSGELETGQAVGDYLLDEPLGSGPFSEVWRGYHLTDEDNEHPQAIKIATHPLYTQWMADQETFALTVDHPNLLLANEIDFGELPPYLVYDLIEGDSLGQLIELELDFGLRGVLALIKQVTAGLAELHSAGEFHGALKPRNVMLADSGEVLVLDTETARITRDIALFVGRSGNAPAELADLLPYLAPEEIAQPGRTDPRADVYSIGALFYALLTLQTPPEGGPSEDDLAGLPIQVQALILECVAPVDHRLADAGALLGRLDRLEQVLPAEEEDEYEEYEEEDAYEEDEEGAQVDEEDPQSYEEIIGVDSDEFESV